VDQKTSRKVCQLIAGILVADDDLDPAESELFDQLLERFGLPAAERSKLFPVVDPEEAAAELRRMPPAVQRQALEMLIRGAVADGKVVAREQSYLEVVAGAIGLSPGELAELVDEQLSALS
jgi:tellurite resistance protein